MSIESEGGVHKKERLQTTKGKTGAEQYAEYHKLDYGLCASNKVEDVNERGRVKIIDG